MTRTDVAIVTQTAIDAAVEALMVNTPAGSRYWAHSIVIPVLKAAAPHIAAAERERIRQHD